MYGSYCGECAGTCFTVYKVTSDSLWIESDNKFFHLLGKDSIMQGFKGTGLSKEEQQKAVYVIKDIPDTLTKLNSLTFGCPDCADQCGIFLEFKIKGVFKRFLIDPEYAAPNGLRNYFDEIADLIWHFPRTH